MACRESDWARMSASGDRELVAVGVGSAKRPQLATLCAVQLSNQDAHARALPRAGASRATDVRSTDVCDPRAVGETRYRRVARP
jgi:hypothetical protein